MFYLIKKNQRKYMAFPTKKECISIFIGSPMVNLATTVWEVLSLEHGLKPDGTVQSIAEDSFSKLKEPSSFFTQTKSGKNVPKALLIDLDPASINEIKGSVYRNLFDYENMLCGKGSAGLYSVAYQEGAQYFDKILDKIRKMADNCQNLDSLLIYSSLHGGTGAGLTSFLLENLIDSYEKVDRIGINLFPAKDLGRNHQFMDYNLGFSFLKVLNNLDASIVFDNETIYSLCKANYQDSPVYYTSVNRMISQFISGITAPHRFDGAFKLFLGDIRDTLIPSPALKYLMPCMAPLTAAEKIYQKEPSVYEITNSLFNKGSCLASCESIDMGIIAGNLYYRGEILPSEINKTLEEFEKSLKFTTGSLRGFNTSLNYFPNMYVPGGDMGRYMKSCCSLINGLDFLKVLNGAKENYKDVISSNSYKRWVLKYDENYELLGGDIANPLKEMEQISDLYQQSETEIIEEI